MGLGVKCAKSFDTRNTHGRGYGGEKWWSWDLNPGVPASKAPAPGNTSSPRL